MDPQLTTLSPVLQYGFAGFSMLLLGVIVWQTKQLVNVIKANNRVVMSCTHAIEKSSETGEEVRKELRAMRDEQLRRGCPFKVSAVPTAQPSCG